MQAGIFPMVVRVTDVNGNSFQAALTLRVSADGVSLSSMSLAGASAGIPYSQTISAVGGTGPYTYTVTSGTLPTGLSLSSAGVVTGTSNTPGTYNFAIQAKDSAGVTTQTNYTIVVASSMPQVISSSLPNAIVNQSFSAPIRVQAEPRLTRWRW